jgi:predicted  nucleic acid-binding Zn-ribbon protein
MLSGCPECGGTKFQFRPDGFDGATDSGAGASGADNADDGGATDETPASPPEPTDRPGDSVSRTVGNAAATVRDFVGGSADDDARRARPPSDSGGTGSSTASTTGSPAGSTGASDATDDDIIVAESDPTAEDTAQADARSQLVDPEEMPDSGGFDPSEADGRTVESEADGSDAPATDERSVAEQPDTERADRPDLAELREELNDQFESIRVVEPGQYELNLMELYDREEYIIALQEDGRYSIQVPETWRQADA